MDIQGETEHSFVRYGLGRLSVGFLGEESLVILSNLDAVTSALQNTITDTNALTVPFIIRALQYIGEGLGVLARLATLSVHQLSLHRRDAALWEAKSRRISSRQLATLRHAPFLASQYVFEPETLQSISDERQEDAQKRPIMRVATTPLQSPRAQKQTPVKRSLSLPSTPQSASKKYRKQTSPRKVPAAQGAHTRSATSSPTRATSKSHRWLLRRVSGGLPKHAPFRHPSRHVVKRTRGCRDEGTLERKFTRWRKIKTLLASLASHGRQQESSKMAQIRISPPIRSIVCCSKGSPSSIPASSGQFNCMLSGPIKTVRFKRNVDIISSETVHNSHVRGGGRLLL